MAEYIFKRVEKKYILTLNQYDKLLPILLEHMELDQYGLHTITNLYLDTDDFVLVRRSIEKPEYKEKLRLRSYGVPDENSTVFLEMKKKYNGVVYKRRIAMNLPDAEKYMERGDKPEVDSQILKEIDYSMNYYNNPCPKVYIAYDRMAYFEKEDSEFRITFDTNVRYRLDELKLEEGDYGTQILPEGKYLMEIKTTGAMPSWLADALCKAKIYPASFSKYGTIFINNFNELMNMADRRNNVR